MTAIHAELSATGTDLVLVAGGLDVDDIALAARRLKALTPLFRKSDPPGALVTTATWPAVVQLAQTFGQGWRPGPRLQAWIAEHVAARTAAGVEAISYTPPAGLTPYLWQIAGASMIAALGGALITDEPGTGKTITAILGLAERAYYGTQPGPVVPIVVVCPASVVDPWVEAWRTWCPDMRAVAWRGPQRKALAGTADVYVTSYDTARLDAPPAGTKAMRALTELQPAAVVIDECFPAGTMVTTPTGWKPIERLRVGDRVVGVDHETGEPVVTTVRATNARYSTEALTTVNGLDMTPNHPVWTARGYVRADAVRPTDDVCLTVLKSLHGHVHAELRVVRADVHQGGQAQQASEVLQPGVLGEVAYVEPGLRCLAADRAEADGVLQSHARGAVPAGGAGEAGGAPERSHESSAGPGRACKGSGDSARAGLPDAQWWQRAVDRAAEVARCALGLGDRGADRHGPEGAVSGRVQGGPGLTRADDRHRGGRGESQEPEGPRVGRSTGRPADWFGLDDSPVLEPAGAGGHRDRDGSDHGGRRVFNIETGTGNYVAGGLLVHNCHYIKNPHAKRSQAVRRLAKHAECVVAMSGTPITHHPADLWPSLVAITPDAWPSSERWVSRYCEVIAGDYRDEILGLNPHTEPEFRLTLLGQHRRVAKADVLDQLPPKIYSVRTVELPAAWRKVYDDFEAQMLAELPDGSELSVMDALSVFTHLSRLASAAADVEITHGPDVDEVSGELKRHVHLQLKAPSWKVDALLEVLEERPGEPVVAFAPSSQLVKLAGAAAVAAGLRVGYIVGGQSMTERTRTVEAFQAGQLDLVCVTTGAGGVGLTLTAARTVVFLQRPWSLVEAIQAEDRCHRIGSEHHDSIEIVDIVASNTIDTRVRAVLRERAGQLADVVQDPRIVAELLGGSEQHTLSRKKAS